MDIGFEGPQKGMKGSMHLAISLSCEFCNHYKLEVNVGLQNLSKFVLKLFTLYICTKEISFTQR